MNGQLVKDEHGNYVRREVGWWEHLGRNIIGGIQKFFTGKDTFSPDSPDSAHFKEKYDSALKESAAYVRRAEEQAKK